MTWLPGNPPTPFYHDVILLGSISVPGPAVIYFWTRVIYFWTWSGPIFGTCFHIIAGCRWRKAKLSVELNGVKPPILQLRRLPPAMPRHATPLIALQQEEKEYSVWSCEGFSLKL